MIKTNLRYILLFVFSVLAQALLFDRIYLSNYVNVFIYVLFILVMPINMNKFLLMAIAFFLGLSIDIFNSTQGLHASAAVLLAFLRPYVLGLYAPRDEYDINKAPGIKNYGLSWFLKYSLTLILAHHLFLFYIEIFNFSHFFFTLGKALISSVFSLFFVILGHLLFARE